MEKQRHGCVTAWLWMIVVISGLTSVVYLTMGDDLARAPGMDVEGWLMPVMAVLSLVNIVFGVALLKWKRWGFYGFAVMTVVALVLNLAGGLAPGQSLSGIIGVFVLYVILQVKGADQVKAWDHLE